MTRRPKMNARKDIKDRNPFALALQDFLLRRILPAPQFATGDWLATLSESELRDFLLYGHFALAEHGCSNTDDFLQVLVAAAWAENGPGLHINDLDELIGELCCCAMSEMQRRAGVIKLLPNAKLRLFPLASDGWALTEEGHMLAAHRPALLH